MIEEGLPAFLSRDPLETYFSHKDLWLFDLGSIIDKMDSTLDSTSHLKSSSWVSTYEPIPPLATFNIPPSIISPHRLELRLLVNPFKYVFLGLKRPDQLLYLLFCLVIKRKN